MTKLSKAKQISIPHHFQDPVRSVLSSMNFNSWFIGIISEQKTVSWNSTCLSIHHTQPCLLARMTYPLAVDIPTCRREEKRM